MPRSRFGRYFLRFFAPIPQGPFCSKRTEGNESAPCGTQSPAKVPHDVRWTFSRLRAVPSFTDGRPSRIAARPVHDPKRYAYSSLAKALRRRRDKLERSIQSLTKTLEAAPLQVGEGLVGHIRCGDDAKVLRPPSPPPYPCLYPAGLFDNAEFHARSPGPMAGKLSQGDGEARFHGFAPTVSRSRRRVPYVGTRRLKSRIPDPLAQYGSAVAQPIEIRRRERLRRSG